MKSNLGIKIDYDSHSVYIDGISIDLTPKEFEILYYFIENEGRILSREQILNRIWGYEYLGSLRTVDTHIYRLRMKLKDKADYIKSVWGLGYKFEIKS